MPSFIHAKSTDFELDDTGGTSRSLSNVLTSVDFPETIDTAESTAFGSTSKSYLVGLRDATRSTTPSPTRSQMCPPSPPTFKAPPTVVRSGR